MKILELMHSLEEAYERFGDIDVLVDAKARRLSTPYALIIDPEEFIIKCE